MSDDPNEAMTPEEHDIVSAQKVIADLRAALAASEARIAELEAQAKPTEPSKEMISYVDEVIAEYAAYINSEPPLLSILYDVDLLPEQISTILRVNPMAAVPNATRMTAICELWKRELSAAARIAQLTAVIEGMDAALKFAESFVTDELAVRIDSHTIRGDMSTLDETDGGLCGEAMDCEAKIIAARATAKAAMEGENG